MSTVKTQRVNLHADAITPSKSSPIKAQLAKFVNDTNKALTDVTDAYHVACDQRDVYAELYDEELQRRQEVEGDFVIEPRDYSKQPSASVTAQFLINNMKRHPEVMRRLLTRQYGSLYASF